VKAAFDNSFLTLALAKKGPASVPKAVELVDDLIEKLEAKKAKVIIPTPTLTEVLLKAPKSGPNYLEKLKSFACFQIKPFDEKAAVELAETLLASAGRKRGKGAVSKMKVTFDRQIVAVAKAHGATEMYSDDKEVRDFSEECGIEAYGFADLKLSPKQGKLPYDKADQSVPGTTKVHGSNGESTQGQTGTEKARENTE
jgi:predicted nucleic acid-binding protein